MAGYSPGQMDCGTLQSFGDAALDSQFSQEVGIASQFYSPYAANVYILNECSIDQAKSFSDPSGFIMFGYYCAERTIIQTGSSLPLAGILAHEWAHQVQFANQWQVTGSATAAPVELEADAFSGIYMGLVKAWAGSQLDAYFQTLFSLGDWNFNDPNHHGTPDQRVAAGMVGLNLASEIIQSGQTISFTDAHNIIAAEIGQILQTAQAVPGDGVAKLKEQARRSADELPWPANVHVSRLDYQLIAGIAAGTRSAREFGPMPPASERRRRSLYLTP